MKDQNQHIKDIFGDKLSEFGSSVDPSVWTSIQSGISTGTTATGASGLASSASLSIGAKILIALATVAGITSIAVLSLAEPEEKILVESPLSEVETETISSEVERDDEVVLAEKPLTSSDDIVQISASSIKPEAEQVSMPIENTYYSEEYSLDRTLPSEREKQYEAYEREANPPVQAPEPEELVTEPVIEVVQSNQVAPLLSSDFRVIRDLDNPMKFRFEAQGDPACEFEWQLSDGHVTSSLNFDYEFSEEGTFEVQLIASNDASEAPAHVIEVEAYLKPKVIVPNIFTPNGDAFNPYFDLEAKSINVTFTRVQVYNMKQELVFESSDSTNKWDGCNRFGEDCEAGKYICVYEALGLNSEPLKGSGLVTIKR